MRKLRVGFWFIEAPGRARFAMLAGITFAVSDASTEIPVFQTAPVFRGGSLPWESAELLGPKPRLGEFGYVQGNMPHPCTLDELRMRIKNGWGRVPTVWTPDSPLIVPAVEAPAIFESVRARLISRMKWLAVRSMLLATGISAALYFGAKSDNVPLQDIQALILMLFIFWGVYPTVQAFRSINALRRFTLRDMFVQGRQARYEVWVQRKRLIGTWLVGLCIVAVALAQIRMGWDKSADAAGLIKPLPVGQWWRLLTYCLMHGSFVHIGVNLFALALLGRWTEVHARSAFVPLVFLIASVGAGLTSLHFGASGDVSVGASGGLMGLVGFLAVMGYRRRNVLPEGFFGLMIANVILISVTGFAGRAMIDNAAHYGGFVAGAIVGLVTFARPPGSQPRIGPLIGGVASALILIALSIWTTGHLWAAGTLQHRIDAIPARQEIAPGYYDATRQFQSIYSLPGTFIIEGAKIDSRNTGGQAIATMRGRFLKAGLYRFAFEEVDSSNEVFQMRIVRARVLENGTPKVIVISPEDGSWNTYEEGMTFSRVGALAVIEWPDETTGLLNHWHLSQVLFVGPEKSGK